jgi:hypothetical protein
VGFGAVKADGGLLAPSGCSNFSSRWLARPDATPVVVLNSVRRHRVGASSQRLALLGRVRKGLRRCCFLPTMLLLLTMRALSPAPLLARG